MDITTILSISTLVLIIVALLLATFLLTVKSKNKLSNRFLAAFLIILSLTISVFVYGFYVQLNLGYEKVRDDIGILLNPLLHFYILTSLYSGFQLRKIHLLHLFPFILCIVLFIPGFYLVDEAAKRVYMSSFEEHPEVQVYEWVTSFQSLFYIFLNYWVLAKAKKVLLENYTDARLLMHRWLFQLNTVSFAILGFSFFKSYYRDYAPNQDAMNIVRILTVYLLISFLCWIVMKALYYPALFRGIDARIKPVSELIEQEEKTTEQTNDPAEQQKIDQLLIYMDAEKPFLDPSLTLQKLARSRTMAPNELSILINHKIGKHFFDFINEYRIQEAQAILKDPEQKQVTVLEILYQVGFNSKSSFNTAFKKYTKMTPTQFRKSHA